MPITRLNHAVLYVADLDRSVRFYTDVMGFRAIPMAPEGFRAAFLQAPGSINDHDLGLFEIGSQAALSELERLAGVLTDAGALTGASDHGTTKSLYGADPDGLEFEVAWIVPAELLDDAARDARRRIGRLDLAKEKERYGAETHGGIRPG